jgi:cytochrome oxidase Cu insertion factor (SCO1/SenC/PrrC family)
MITTSFIQKTFISLAFAALLGSGAAAQTKSKLPSCCKPAPAKSRGARTGQGSQGDAIGESITSIPDATLIDQDGHRVHLRDLVRGKVVAMNFIFTTCTTICPPMGANFAKLSSILGDEAGRDVILLSVSIDPTTDTPERLKAWSEKFNAGPGWTLLTGEKREVDDLLKTLKVFSPVKETHSPIVLIGKEGEGKWIRTNGLAAPGKLAELIRGRLAANPSRAAIPAMRTSSSATAADENPDLNYFTDVKLIDQHGDELRLYSDLLKGKTVVVNPFFEQCTGSCPVMNAMMERLQAHLGEKLGKDVVLMSITVDPANDTPGTLKDYAARFHARNGWYFLSGKRENVETALRKLGEFVDVRENHSTIVLIGNVSTRLWKKVNGLASSDEIIKVLDGVIDDAGGTK